jgi:lipopolysaccharide export system ATP-binding protein
MQSFSAFNMYKTYDNRKVVDDVSLAVTPGEIVGILGPNGAGKTTSFYIMAGLIKPDSGKIFFNDQDISKKPLHKRAKIGISYLPQEASVFRKLTVYNNIKAIVELHYPKAKVKETVEKLLAEFHIGHIKNTMGISLSGGERRRIEIARAIANNPSYILLDEPFAGIDPISIIDIKRMIKQLSEQNMGIIITDHNVRETLEICDRAYIMHLGKIIAHGSQQEILSDENVRRVYLGDEFKL